MTKYVNPIPMTGKIRTATWFIKNPQYIPHIFQILKRKRNSFLGNSGVNATAWCQAQCISQEEALKILVLDSKPTNLKDLYPGEINKARQIVENCPVKMGGEGAISFIYHLVKNSGAKKILETGVAYGWSSLAILLAIKEKEGSHLISNDMPYINMGNEDYVGCIIPAQLKAKWQLQRLPDIKGIPLALKKFNHSIDLCHYDSDKSYTGRMWASPLLWNSLKDGGFFVSDDINDNLAFQHFCQSVHRTPVIIEHLGKYVGVIVK
ncbi:MAG: class I SAM-dependent methyltransferase [Ginsengibacter sp.]